MSAIDTAPLTPEEAAFMARLAALPYHHVEPQQRPRSVGRPPVLRGAANPNAKLSEADVAEIRRLYRPGGPTMREIGRRFGVGPRAVSHVVRGERW